MCWRSDTNCTYQPEPVLEVVGALVVRDMQVAVVLAIENTLLIPWRLWRSQKSRATWTSDNLTIALARQAAPAAIVDMVQIGASPSESYVHHFF